MDNLQSLFKYLDAENISVDREEFDFQFNSHPDYPTLLALSDTLAFFNVKNGAFNVNKTEIDLLPNKFLAKLNKNNSDFFSYVQKENDSIVYSNGVDYNSMSKIDFESLWSDVVLLVENDVVLPQPKLKNRFNYILPSLTVLFGVSVTLLTAPKNWFLLFYALPIIGLLFSVAALKDLFSTKNKLLNKFCNISANTSCKTIVNSTKWKVLDIVSFSDLGIVFFSTQLVALFLMGLLNLYTTYFSIQTILLVSAIPVILLSLYYQKYVEKKWCPICLVIVGVVVLELGAVLFINTSLDVNITVLGLLIFLGTTTFVTAVWLPLKSTFKKVNQLKAVELKANRFKRNYQLFRKMLTNSEPYNLPKSLVQFGSTNAPLNISIVTSPYCGYCKEPHYMLESIIKKYGKDIKTEFFYNVKPNVEKLLNFAETLSYLRMNKGDNTFFEAMDYWYETKDDKKWLKKYQANKGTNKVENSLEKHHKWFTQNSINFTPCLFINGYLYPKEYDIAELPFFIDELIDDKTLLVKHYKIRIAETEKL